MHGQKTAGIFISGRHHRPDGCTVAFRHDISGAGEPLKINKDHLN